MRIQTILLLVGLGACSAPARSPASPDRPAPAAPAPSATPTPAPAQATWTRVWAGDVRNIGGLWAMPTMHAQQDGAKLMLDVAVSVLAVSDLTTTDVAVELYAGNRRLACGAPAPMGFTQTGSITAQASIACENPKHELPTRVVVAVRGSRETFEMKLASLTTAI